MSATLRSKDVRYFNQVSKKIRDLRKSKKLSYRQIAKRTGLSVATVSSYEKGAWPTGRGFAALSQAFNMDMKDFIRAVH